MISTKKQDLGFNLDTHQISKLLKVQNDSSFNMPIQRSLQASLLQPNTTRMWAWNFPTKSTNISAHSISNTKQDVNFTKLTNTHLNPVNKQNANFTKLTKTQLNAE